MSDVAKKLFESFDSIKSQIPFEPKVGLVLGSGLGDFAEGYEPEAVIDYKDVKGFPVSTAPGHKGRFLFIHVEGVPVVCMQGRVHYYEGYDMADVVLPIRLMGLMGAEFIFLTNASGGLKTGCKAGELMLITDHIATFMPSPLRGPNVSELGVRFPDMSSIYNHECQDVVRKAARKLDIRLQEGVYVQAPGPQYETPQEVRMFKQMGGDAVGMSTACEAIAANHMGKKVLGVSCISNLAAGISLQPLTEEEVLEAGAAVAPQFKKLVAEVIKNL